MDRDEINAFGRSLQALRLMDERSVTVSITAHAGSIDTPHGSVSATVEVDGEIATSEAVHLEDALLMARAKARRAIEARRQAEAGEKPKRGRRKASPTPGIHQEHA